MLTAVGTFFFAKYGGPSGESLLLGGAIIILRVIRRHFLVAAWTQLSASPRTVLFRWKSVVDHIDHGARQDAAVDAQAERSTSVHWFG